MAGMTPGSRGDREQGMRAALGALLRRLRELSVDGVVAREDFLAVTSELGLTDQELSRLEGELRQFKLRVSRPGGAVGGLVERPSPSRTVAVPATATAVRATVPEQSADEPIPVRRVEKQTAARKTAVEEYKGHSPRIAATLGLARRFAESGHMTDRVLPGLARLCGLGAGEAAQLAAAMAQPAGATETLASAAVSGPIPAEPFPETPPPSENLPAIPAPSSPAASRMRSAQITAARSLLAERRLVRRPAKRLLTAQEEIGLTLLMRGEETDSGETPLTEKVLAALPRDDIRRRAYEAMVEHNMGLVFEMRKKHTGQGVEDEDLTHHGVLGLMHAACKFDPDRGFKFSTYAFHWIRQAMSRAVADYGSAIRIPVHLHEEMHKVAAAEARLRETGHPATPAAVALATGLPVTRVEEIRSISRVTTSLDRELFEGANLGDAVSYDLPSEGPEDLLYHRWSREDIEQRLLGRLDAKSADILRRRSGLIDGEPQTLDTIGTVYGVTRERIRQIETKARDRLKTLLADQLAEERRARSQPQPGPVPPSRSRRSADWKPPRTAAADPPDSVSSQGLTLAAQRMVSALSRTALARLAGVHGAHLIRVIAEGRLPGSAASTRLRGILLEYGRPPGERSSADVASE
ncbi:RNA polymerase sigma factor RpoD/SigA [Streptomyces sp. NPDC048282]|uniref:sigma-70 family RNA polymerase sigma factor n=1 Tax=Streptomyces sp. NPDC048282 TaxID=3365528 RepID=UPI0037247D8B